MSSELLLSIIGGILIILLGIVGYFFKIVHKDVQKCIGDNINNEKRIVQIDLKVQNNQELIVQKVGYEFELMRKDIGQLITDVKNLCSKSNV